MVYQYVVTLKNTAQRFIDNLSFLLLLVSVLLFIREQYYTADSRVPYLYGLSAIIIFLTGWNIFQKRKGQTVYYSRALFTAAIGWALVDQLHWLIIPFLLMAMIEKTAKKPLEIGFGEQEIVINALIRRRYQWTDFSNIVLKDDLLTLDFVNNRLLQRETIDEEGDADEDEFNAWCQGKLLGSGV